MNSHDYISYDGVALAEMIKRKEVGSKEVLETAINIIEKLNPILNAVVIKNYDNVMRDVETLSINTMLSGVPFLLKDVNLFTSDMPTTFSCKFFENAKPREDSELVSRWRSAGLMFLGKTNTPEFANDFVCEPTLRGATLNPWNPKVTTGGSSGGAAAAVASGMVPIAHGSDLGGSIRIPAACCGVFGLKPTSGLNPSGPYFSEMSAGFNADHVLSRSVRDSAAVLDLSAGPMRGLRYHVSPIVDSFLLKLEEPVPKLRIGMTKVTPNGDPVGPNQELAVDKVSTLLSSFGHEVCEYNYPKTLNLGSWMENLWMMDVVYEIDKRIIDIGQDPESQELDALTRYCREHVATLTAMDLYLARQQAHETGFRLMQSMENLDLILTPSLASDPVLLGEIDSRTDNFDILQWHKAGHAFAPFAYICNVAGQPSASLPIQLLEGEHPCAVQLAGHHLYDHIILQVAHQLEKCLDWSSYRPPIWRD